MKTGVSSILQKQKRENRCPIRVSVLLSIVFFSLCSTLWAKLASAMVRFEDLPQLVKEKNEHYKAAQIKLDSAETRRGYFLRSVLPKVELHAGAEAFSRGHLSRRSQPFGDLSASLNLFRGGRDTLESEIREGEFHLAETEASTVQAEELTKARKGYWSLVFAREVESILLEALRKNSENLLSTKKRLSAGMGTETDRIEFEIRQTSLEQEVEQVKLDQQNLIRQLNVLMGQEMENPIPTPSRLPHEHEDLTQDKKLELEQHREVKALLIQEELSSLSQTREARWWTPSLDLFGSYGYFTEREIDGPDFADRKETVMGARLTFTLFDGGSSHNEAQALKKETESLSLRQAQTRRELLAAFEGEKAKLLLMHTLIKGADTNVAQAQTYLKRSLSEYARGLKNSPDILGASQREVDALLRSAEMRRDYQLAKTEILGLLGH